MTSNAHQSLYASSRYSKKMNEICAKYDTSLVYQKNKYLLILKIKGRDSYKYFNISSMKELKNMLIAYEWNNERAVWNKSIISVLLGIQFCVITFDSYVKKSPEIRHIILIILIYILFVGCWNLSPLVLSRFSISLFKRVISFDFFLINKKEKNSGI